MRAGTWVLLRDSKETAHLAQVPFPEQQPDEAAIGKLPAIPGRLLREACLHWILELDKSNGTWRRVPEREWELRRQAKDVAFDDCCETNQALEDCAANQSVKFDEVEEMKKQGLNSQEIIDTLMDGSITFNSKTKLAQLKWLEKKEKKHRVQLEVLPVTLMSLCEKYAESEFKRTAGLRWDYLSTMIGIAGIRPGMRILLLDQGMGLLTAAVLDRLQGNGCIYRLGGDQLSSRAVDFFDFPKRITDVIQNIPLDLFDMSLDMTPDDFDNPKHAANDHIWIKPPRDFVSAPNMVKEREADDNPEDVEFRAKQQKNYYTRQRTRALVLQLLLQHGVHACLGVISTLKCPGIFDEHDSKNLVVRAAEKLLVSDGKFVLFSLNHAIALSAQLELISDTNFTAAKFQELFLREYQVLPLRTHPIMTGAERHYTGFLTSAVRIGT